MVIVNHFKVSFFVLLDYSLITHCAFFKSRFMNGSTYGHYLGFSFFDSIRRSDLALSLSVNH